MHILPSLANALLLGLVVVFINVDLLCIFLIIPLLEPGRFRALRGVNLNNIQSQQVL